LEGHHASILSVRRKRAFRTGKLFRAGTRVAPAEIHRLTLRIISAYRHLVAREVWAVGEAYEAYVGRWSRVVAMSFVTWLAAPVGGRWLDVGCGTGALTSAVLDDAEPAVVVGLDPSAGFLATARGRGVRALWCVGDARSLPLPDRRFDAVVSGLALNFVPDPARAVAELVRVVRPGGGVAAYVWDYAEGMEMMRHFWDSAIEIDPVGADLDEGRRFLLCREEPLRDLWAGAGLDRISVTAIDVPTVFADFDDYWRPFLGGQGAAPAYLMSLDAADRDVIRDLLRRRLPFAADGTIPLTARAWAVRGTVPA
jgi:SAM-dependent methyltransferase